MNSSICSRLALALGVAFAIPSALAQPVTELLMIPNPTPNDLDKFRGPQSIPKGLAAPFL